MADIFKVPVSRFFEDPEVLFPGLAGGESPSRESNPGPSHCEVSSPERCAHLGFSR